MVVWNAQLFIIAAAVLNSKHITPVPGVGFQKRGTFNPYPINHVKFLRVMLQQLLNNRY